MKESIIKEEWKDTVKTSILLSILLIVFEIVICFWNRAFIILVWIPFLPFINMLKRKRFFKNAEFCYGKVIDVTLSEDSDVYIYTKVEFLDCYSKEIYQAVVENHWGDFRGEDKDKINEFYDECRKRIGKKVPLLYKKCNPNKNMIFINNIED